MNINEFLAHFDDVKRTAPNQWRARCPSHDDRVSSLSITANADGIGLYCHAGCRTEDVVKAAGLTMSDLFFDHKEPRSRITATYDYTDRDGALLFQVVRYTPKGFRQRRPDGKGGWIWNLQGVRRVPYHLPELISADPSEPVYVVEGEKDSDRLRSLGLTATCNPGGAGKWRTEYNRFFQDRNVIIVPDNDEPGRKHADEVKEALTGVARSIVTVELPGLGPKQDVSDWLAAGHDKGELLDLVERARAYTTTGTPGEATVTSTGEFQGPNLTDTGNAERLVHLHGNDMRYSFERRKWLVWDNRRWRWDESGQVFRWTKDVLKHLHAEASKADDSAVRKSLGSWANDSESQQHRRAMVTLAESEPGIPIALSELDGDPWLLNTLSGVVDLRTGRLYPHKRENLITKIVPVEYNPDAKSPLWEKFLKEIFDGNEELIEFIQRAAGYSLTGDTSERCLFILHGRGKNGKSTFLETLQAIVGDYGLRTPTETLLVKRGGSIPNDIARLRGARFVSAAESDEGRRLAEARIKDLTGNDTISARFLHAEYFDFRPECKIWFATNHRPTIKGTDQAIWDRIRLVPFNVRIPDEKQDKHLLNKLQRESPGILTWAVEGCLKWQESGLSTPEIVTLATESYRDEMDVLSDFISERCAVSNMFEEKFKELYQAYLNWCTTSGDSPISRRAFSSTLQERGFVRAKRHGHVVFRGIGLITDDERVDEVDDLDENSVFLNESPHKEKTEKTSRTSPLSPSRNGSGFPQSGPGDDKRPALLYTRKSDEQDLAPF